MGITTALELRLQVVSLAEGAVGEGAMHETDFPLNHNRHHNGHKASLLRVAVPQ